MLPPSPSCPVPVVPPPNGFSWFCCIKAEAALASPVPPKPLVPDEPEVDPVPEPEPLANDGVGSGVENMLLPGLLIEPPELELKPAPKLLLGCCTVLELMDCPWALANDSPQVSAPQIARQIVSIRRNRMVSLSSLANTWST
ncbi:MULTISPECIES: hypothetical protein [Pirellulaceae]|uniref:hypothetical protein n=1 Tax=Pirellulaceae TaxID=2691357 RepID=UPI001E402C7F|nr:MULTISPECIES: hypothetical protein [Pirellulaceae]